MHKIGVIATLAVIGVTGMVAVIWKVSSHRRGSIRRDVYNEPKNVVFRVKALDSEAPEYLAKLIKERISKTGLEYALLSVFGDGGSDSLLIIRGARPEEVVIEGEVVQALASTLGKFRVEKLNVERVSCINEIISISRPKRSGRAIVLLDGDRGSQVNGPRAGGILIGSSVGTPTPRPVYLTAQDLEGHAAIFGATGSGKSTTADSLACRIYRQGFARVIVLDWTGEHSQRLRKCGARIINPVSDGIGIWVVGSTSIDTVLEVLSLALGLTPPQEYLLMKALESGIPASLSELASRIEEMPEDARWDREVKRGLLRRIGILASRYSSIFKMDADADHRIEGIGGFRSGSEGLMVVDLSEIEVSQARKAAALLFLAREYELKRRGSRDWTIYIVEEAHNVFERDDSSFANLLLAEARKYGMSLVVVTQSPSRMSNNVILNTNIKIIHSIRSKSDKELVSDSLGLSPNTVNLLDKLNKGEALVYAPSLGEPVFVKVELPEPLRKFGEDAFIG